MTDKCSLGDLLCEGADLFRAAHVPEPRRTASLLMRELLRVDTATLIAHPENLVSQTDAERVRQAFERRAAGEPAQYITGHQEFYGLDFLVTPAVLIPRPETELLVEVVLKFCTEKNLSAPRVIDVGTGSGCIAVTLAVHLPGARITAVDISPAALGVAQENAARHEVQDRITFVESDYLSALLQQETAPADVVASNPPYVAAYELQDLQREVRDFEPVTALVGGPKGTEGYARLLATAARMLAPGGILVCEVGYTQAEQVIEIGQAAGWRCEQVVSDLQGIPRTLAFCPLSAVRSPQSAVQKL